MELLLSSSVALSIVTSVFVVKLGDSYKQTIIDFLLLCIDNVILKDFIFNTFIPIDRLSKQTRCLLKSPY